MNFIDRGLVLEGGGLRGQYTAGVLDAYLGAGIAFPYIIGVSAGASIALLLRIRTEGTEPGDSRALSETTAATFFLEFAD
jgi:predicted acylesterase/phospholipase RssA